MPPNDSASIISVCIKNDRHSLLPAMLSTRGLRARVSLDDPMVLMGLLGWQCLHLLLELQGHSAVRGPDEFKLCAMHPTEDLMLG